MTAPVPDLVAAANVDLPAGWRIEAVEVRRYRYRSEWRVDAVHGRLVRASWKTYRVAAFLPVVIDWIGKQPTEPDLAVTTDAAGWVRDIGEVA